MDQKEPEKETQEITEKHALITRSTESGEVCLECTECDAALCKHRFMTPDHWNEEKIKFISEHPPAHITWVMPKGAE